MVQPEPNDEEQPMREKHLSTEEALYSSVQLSDRPGHMQLISDHGGVSHRPHSPKISPEKVPIARLALTAATLERRMQDVMNQILSQSKTKPLCEKDEQELARLKDEWNTIQQCLDICSRADGHLRNEVSAIDDYGTGHASKVIVTTYDQLQHGKNRASGWRMRQVGGYVSDDSVQALSKDIAAFNTGVPKGEEPPSEEYSTLDQSDQVKGYMTTSEFHDDLRISTTVRKRLPTPTMIFPETSNPSTPSNR